MPSFSPRFLPALAIAATLAPPAAQASTQAKQIKHVFVIVLENKNYSVTFGSSTQDPYLQKILVPSGTLLTQYYGTGHVSLDNYISLISGQSPTPDTTNDCIPGISGSIGNYNDVAVTGIQPKTNQVIATGGCIYPATVQTLPDQLTAAGLTWRGYMEDMGNDPAREAPTCGHPPFGTATDFTETEEAPSAAVPMGDTYATRHNPFMYFHSIIDSPACATNVVNLGQLPADLSTYATTPNLVFITPGLCHDGHDGAGTGAPGSGCATGEPGGLTSIDAFLKSIVPEITTSDAFRQDGLLIITFDESNYALSVSANGSQEVIDINFPGQACCGQLPGPNLAGERPGTVNVLNTPTLAENLVFGGYGGDQVGALLISPFVKRGSTSSTPYNHYSTLRTIETIFNLGYLGYAAKIPSIGYNPGGMVDDPNIFYK